LANLDHRTGDTIVFLADSIAHIIANAKSYCVIGWKSDYIAVYTVRTAVTCSTIGFSGCSTIFSLGITQLRLVCCFRSLYLSLAKISLYVFIFCVTTSYTVHL
jgi:hypothetical protein